MSEEKGEGGGPDPSDTVALAAAPYLTRGVALDGLLCTLVDTIVDLVDADRGTLYLVDGGRRALTSVVAHLPEMERISLRFGQGIAGCVAASGTLENVRAPGEDPRHDGTFDTKTGFRTHSLLVVPLHDGSGAVIGVLQLLNASRGWFNEDDERRATELAVQAGRVLEGTSLHAQLRRARTVDVPHPTLAYRFNHIVGESEAMSRVYARVDKAAGTEATVLVTGETGTGKELIARAVHVNSRRREGPFVKVDCTTLPEALVENELFGHERGAFTGADRTVPGKFEVAQGGTVFLDEIGELPLAVQGKLLRVLQDRALERVGGTSTVRVDFRLVCATHRDLAALVDAGRFREDLFYRLRVVPIPLPPLRERGTDDLQRLVEHFVGKFARRHGRPIEHVTRAAFERLENHSFPGNVRELENCIESAVVLCDGGVIDVPDLPLVARHGAVRLGDPDCSLEAVERAHAAAVVRACGGNRTAAAKRLGIGRNTLARKLA